MRREDPCAQGHDLVRAQPHVEWTKFAWCKRCHWLWHSHDFAHTDDIELIIEECETSTLWAEARAEVQSVDGSWTTYATTNLHAEEVDGRAYLLESWTLPAVPTIYKALVFRVVFYNDVGECVGAVSTPAVKPNGQDITLNAHRP